jgi:hypothetical protein
MSAPAFSSVRPAPDWHPSERLRANPPDPSHLRADQNVQLHSLTSLEELNNALQLDGSRNFGSVGSMNIGDQLPENVWSTASATTGLGSRRNDLDRQESLGTALQQAIAGSSQANKPKTIEETWRDIQQHVDPASRAANPNNLVKVEGSYNNQQAPGAGWRGVAPAYGGAAFPGVPSMGVAPAGLNTGLLEEILRNQRMAAFAAAAAVNASQAGQRQSNNGQAYDGIQQKSPHADALPGAYLPVRPDFHNGTNGLHSDFTNFQMRNAYGNQASGQQRQQQQQNIRSGDNAQNPILVNQQGPPGDRHGHLALSPRDVPSGQGGLVIPKHDPDVEEDEDSSPRGGRGRKRVRIEREKDAKIEKRTLRMIKNRESAARSRLRKQAYTQVRWHAPE